MVLLKKRGRRGDRPGPCSLLPSCLLPICWKISSKSENTASHGTEIGEWVGVGAARGGGARKRSFPSVHGARRDCGHQGLAGPPAGCCLQGKLAQADSVLCQGHSVVLHLAAEDAPSGQSSQQFSSALRPCGASFLSWAIELGDSS